MPWFRVDDSFAAHPKVMAIPRGAARLRAVGLWTAVGTWCAQHLTDGVFGAHIVTELGGTAADTRRLVDAGLWEPTDDGRLQFHDWSDYQPSRVDVQGKQEAARERMRTHRQRQRDQLKSPPRDAGVRANERVTFADRSPTPARPDPTHAAAAADERGSGGLDDQAHQTTDHVAVADLPVGVEILRTRLQAYSQLAALRFDQLTAAQVAELEALAEFHGDERLVDVALRTCRNPPPVSVSAFLGTWRALPEPGRRLGLVRHRCSIHDTQMSSTGVCPGCVADQRAGDR